MREGSFRKKAQGNLYYSVSSFIPNSGQIFLEGRNLYLGTLIFVLPPAYVQNYLELHQKPERARLIPCRKRVLE